MRVVFFGTGEIGVPTLRRLAETPGLTVAGVVTQPDRLAGRSQQLQPSPIKQEAFRLHLPVYQPEKINAASSVAQLRYLQPDVVVVFAYGQILKKQVLELPEKACLNIHASLLPKYRGAACIQGALAAGETETGLTVIWMDEGLDTGDILLQERVSIRRKETAGELHDRLAALAPTVLLRALDLLAKGKATRTKQDESQASYVKKLVKEDGHLDWSKPQRALDWHIRAMTPWPGAYTWIPEKGDHRMLKIFKTILSRRAKGKPGEVLRVDRHGILVAAGEGGLLLREVQLEGRKRLHAAEFARGYNLPVGMILE
ncbi:MAG: methionyl-tRNA formyltransferase [Candidatus Methylacidiphilales bacterium]